MAAKAEDVKSADDIPDPDLKVVLSMGSTLHVICHILPVDYTAGRLRRGQVQVGGAIPDGRLQPETGEIAFPSYLVALNPSQLSTYALTLFRKEVKLDGESKTTTIGACFCQSRFICSTGVYVLFRFLGHRGARVLQSHAPVLLLQSPLLRSGLWCDAQDHLPAPYGLVCRTTRILLRYSLCSSRK